ncbi:MAG: hypothetical protein ITD32_03460 [Candidatus Nitrotoga sp.]|nr:hypothetical protein [Candidatus Nitrotoga sp.]MBP0117218.1 hypothetical protein [Candidatus Nitrotoga sp.]MBP0123338.1 hypothetical protein [Candidatus Nitrotoga sp.]MBP0125838.1 hypothetical protein [Candidatus Nitrotoga sp.]
MDEEQAVLKFFSQKENLPLALSVADHADGIRQKLNNDFWVALAKLIAADLPDWNVATTEDRNSTECLVGVCLQPRVEQQIYLRPMLEQQYLGNTSRIYYGLTWNVTPTPEQKQLGAVKALHDTFKDAGFKSNDNFFAWQWSHHHPRSMDFLLRFSTAGDSLLGEVYLLMRAMLNDHLDTLRLANEKLRESSLATTVSVVSLDKLRANIER